MLAHLYQVHSSISCIPVPFVSLNVSLGIEKVLPPDLRAYVLLIELCISGGQSPHTTVKDNQIAGMVSHNLERRGGRGKKQKHTQNI